MLIYAIMTISFQQCNQASCFSCPGSPQICTSCNQGYYLYGNECLKFCPDGFFHTTDPQNLCLACHSTCKTCNGNSINNCLSCELPKIIYFSACKQCNDVPGFYPLAQNSLDCQEICGDGLRMSTQHECDDGNNIHYDGCTSDCRIENGWECTGGSPLTQDICIDKNPIRYVIIDNHKSNNYQENIKKNEFYLFKIAFSKKFDLPPGKSVQEYIKVAIEGRPDIKVRIESISIASNLRILLDNDQSAQMISFTVKVLIEGTVRNRALSVEIENVQDFQDVKGNTLQKKPKYISPTTSLWIYVPDKQRDAIKIIVQQVEYFIYIIFAFAIYFILTNKLWRIGIAIDFIQYMFMLNFITMRHSLNLQLFFSMLKPMTDFYFWNPFKFDELALQQDDELKINTSNKKIIGEGFNIRFLNNAGSIIFILLLFMAIHLIFRFFALDFMKSINQKFQQKCWDICKSFFEWSIYIDLGQLFFLIIFLFALLDISNSTLLQKTYSIYVTAVNQIIVIVFFIISLFTISLSFWHLYQFRNHRYKEPDEYEEVVIERESAIQGYNVRSYYLFVNSEKLHYFYFLNLLRKIYFSIVVVFYYSDMIGQLSLLVLPSAIFSILLILKRPFLQTRDNFRQIISELFMLLGSSLIYMYANDESEDEQKRLDQCFTTVYTFFILIIVQIAFLVYETFVLPLIKLIKDWCERQKKVDFKIHNQREDRIKDGVQIQLTNEDLDQKKEKEEKEKEIHQLPIVIKKSHVERFKQANLGQNRSQQSSQRNIQDEVQSQNADQKVQISHRAQYEFNKSQQLIQSKNLSFTSSINQNSQQNLQNQTGQQRNQQRQQSDEKLPSAKSLQINEDAKYFQNYGSSRDIPGSRGDIPGSRGDIPGSSRYIPGSGRDIPYKKKFGQFASSRFIEENQNQLKQNDIEKPQEIIFAKMKNNYKEIVKSPDSETSNKLHLKQTNKINHSNEQHQQNQISQVNYLQSHEELLGEHIDTLGDSQIIIIQQNSGIQKGVRESQKK